MPTLSCASRPTITPPCSAASTDSSARAKNGLRKPKLHPYLHMERTPVATDRRQATSTGLLHRTKNTSGRTQKSTACFRFITSLKPDGDHVEMLIRCGRTRWKVENEMVNLLKNQGCHIEHDFGHGKQGLSNPLLTLNPLDFACHSIRDQIREPWIEVRNKFGRRVRSSSLSTPSRLGSTRIAGTSC